MITAHTRGVSVAAVYTRDVAEAKTKDGTDAERAGAIRASSRPYPKSERRPDPRVVLGDRAYYGGFGFVNDPELRNGNVPPDNFQRLVLSGAAPEGDVSFHAAFNAA